MLFFFPYLSTNDALDVENAATSCAYFHSIRSRNFSSTLLVMIATAAASVVVWPSSGTVITVDLILLFDNLPIFASPICFAGFFALLVEPFVFVVVVGHAILLFCCLYRGRKQPRPGKKPDITSLLFVWRDRKSCCRCSKKWKRALFDCHSTVNCRGNKAVLRRGLIIFSFFLRLPEIARLK